MKITGKVVLDGKVVAYITDDNNLGVCDDKRLDEYLSSNSCSNAVMIGSKAFIIGEVPEVSAMPADTVTGKTVGEELEEVNTGALPGYVGDIEDDARKYEFENAKRIVEDTLKKQQSGEDLQKGAEKSYNGTDDDYHRQVLKDMGIIPDNFNFNRGEKLDERHSDGLSALKFGAESKAEEKEPNKADSGEKEYYQAVAETSANDQYGRGRTNYFKGEKLNAKPARNIPFFDEEGRLRLNEFCPNFTKEQMLFGVNVIEQYKSNIRNKHRKIKNLDQSLSTLKEDFPDEKRRKPAENHLINSRIKAISEYMISVLYPISNTNMVDYMAYIRVLTKSGCSKVMKVIDYEETGKKRQKLEEEIYKNPDLMKNAMEEDKNGKFRDPCRCRSVLKIIRHETGELPILNFEKDLIGEYSRLGRYFNKQCYTRKHMSNNSVIAKRYQEFELDKVYNEMADGFEQNPGFYFLSNDFNGMHYMGYNERLETAKKLANISNTMYAKKIRLALLKQALSDTAYTAGTQDSLKSKIEYVGEDCVREKIFINGNACVNQQPIRIGCAPADNDIFVLNEILKSTNVDISQFIAYFKELNDYCASQMIKVLYSADKIGTKINSQLVMDTEIFNSEWVNVARNLLLVNENENRPAVSTIDFLKGMSN